MNNFIERLLDPSVEFISRPVFNYLKSWDKIAAHRPDAYIAISQTVKDRIKNIMVKTLKSFTLR